MAADALSCKSQGSIFALRCRDWRLLEELQQYNLVVRRHRNTAFLSNLVATLVLQIQVIASQEKDENLMKSRSRIMLGEIVENITLGNKGGL